jgi:ERCC4-related helicase
MEAVDVFVFTEKKLYDVLLHGFLKIEDFHMLVFDECHHAD